MIFNPRRGGGEKEYAITAQKPNITLSATKQKPGHIFRASPPVTTSKPLKMEFTDPNTGKSVTAQGSSEGITKRYTFIMPAADATITY